MNELKPFVKWAGGKAKVIEQMSKYFPVELTDGEINTYIEPFVGGGALLIDLLQKYNIKNAYAFDINEDLINCYLVIKSNVEELIKELNLKSKRYKELDDEKRKEYFYDIRKEYNTYELEKNVLSVKRASEFIFLNKTCFNGLYRVNSSNKFNVPFNNAKNPLICDPENLRGLSKLFENVEFFCCDYKDTLKYIDKKTFVYFDPPYRPLTQTAGFTSYTKEDFDDDNQRELAKLYAEVSNKKAKAMLSNSNPKNINKEDDFFDEIYKGFNINEIYAKRNINSKGDGRKAISELLITNY